MFRLLCCFVVILNLLCISSCHQNADNELKPDLKKAAQINVQLGLSYLKQGNRPRAKKKLLLALKQSPRSPDVYAALAYYLEEVHELEQAKTYYLKALTLAANKGPHLNNYGTFLCRQRKNREALSYFLRAVEDPHYLHTAAAYENAGLCVLGIPDLPAAKLYFSKALSQDPSRKLSLYEWVRIESSLNNDKKALEMLQNHSDLVLNDIVFLSLAKKIALKAGHYPLALDYEKRIVAIRPVQRKA